MLPHPNVCAKSNKLELTAQSLQRFLFLYIVVVSSSSTSPYRRLLRLHAPLALQTIGGHKEKQKLATAAVNGGNNGAYMPPAATTITVTIK